MLTDEDIQRTLQVLKQLRDGEIRDRSGLRIRVPPTVRLAAAKTLLEFNSQKPKDGGQKGLNISEGQKRAILRAINEVG